LAEFLAHLKIVIFRISNVSRTFFLINELAKTRKPISHPKCLLFDIFLIIVLWRTKMNKDDFNYDLDNATTARNKL
jgi:hypothetical protein